ncbi:uncharacterized protein [Ambystoma mexicanum]
MKKDYSGTIVLSGAYWDTVDSRQQVAFVHCLELALQWIKRRRRELQKVFPNPNPNPGPSKASENLSMFKPGKLAFQYSLHQSTEKPPKIKLGTTG